jgi:hypothetical protein
MMQRRIGRIIKIALLAIIGVAVFGTLVMQLWNWLMPGLFGWHAVSFWQALGLLILSRIFFGGFRGPSGLGRRRLMNRWDKMTPEEREKLREGLRGRCGKFETPAAEPQTP